MDLGSILFLIALLILVSLFVIRPFLTKRSSSVSKEEHDYSALLAERDRIVNALQELDFDYTLGKIPEEDYPAQRAQLLRRGASVLRQLDAYQIEGPAEDAEIRLEAAISARRGDSGGNAPQSKAAASNGNGRRAGIQPDDDLEALIASRRRERQEKAAGFCPQCGGPLQKSDLFCPKCGNPVAGEAKRKK